jgi:glycosyltransferase involved in cell wall biosynthesis
MRIAIAAEHANSSCLTGVEHYSRELILALANLNTRHNYLLYMRSTPGSWCSHLPRNFVVKQIPSLFAWTQTRLSMAMLLDRPDALLIPSFSMPLLHPKNTVVTIHDLAWACLPSTETRLQRWSLAFTHALARRFAKSLIAVSGSTKRDLVEHLHVPDARIDVVHHGFRDEAPVRREAFTPVALHRLLGGRPFIVCLGTLQPRKNIDRLIDAFCLMKKITGLPHALVIAGRPGWECRELLARIEMTEDVIYPGYVEDRLELLRRAALFVQPSLYEGFGLSILDAFSQRVPVACSDRASLPEVAGDAATYFNPECIASMASAMISILTSPDRAASLQALGSARLHLFTWDSCARKTLSVLERNVVANELTRVTQTYTDA